MTWITSNPLASLFLAVVAVLLALWLISWLTGETEVDHCDHSECERPQVGDLTISIFEHKRVKRTDPGDGVEAGV